MPPFYFQGSKVKRISSSQGLHLHPRVSGERGEEWVLPALPPQALKASLCEITSQHKPPPLHCPPGGDGNHTPHLPLKPVLSSGRGVWEREGEVIPAVHPPVDQPWPLLLSSDRTCTWWSRQYQCPHAPTPKTKKCLRLFDSLQRWTIQ